MTFVQPTLLHTGDKHFKLSHSGTVKLSSEMCFVSTKGKKGQSQWPCGLQLLACCDCSPESHLGHGRFCHCCLLSGSSLCGEPITSPEEFYQVWCV
jgi:hypothetical protein